jgi:beta-galactosidase
LRNTFDWLDRVMDMLANNGAFAVLATPSGARPAWMSRKYPEVLRVRSDGGRNRHGRRHNHCYTSPVYREKTQAMNRMLAGESVSGSLTLEGYGVRVLRR